MWEISSELLENMTAHALREHPREACGLLGGRGDRVLRVVPCRNVAKEPLRSFEIGPEVLFQSFRQFRDQGLETVGVYHSHPGSRTCPSPRDHDEHHYHGWGYWIVAFPGQIPVVRCFQWLSHGFEPAAYRVTAEDGRAL